MATNVPGASVAEQSVRVAGAFAELGVQTLVVSIEGVARTLSVRETDLPGVLGSASAGSILESRDLGITICVMPWGLEWVALEATVSERFALALG